jgi:hypothetical protein
MAEPAVTLMKSRRRIRALKAPLILPDYIRNLRPAKRGLGVKLHSSNL